MIINPLDYTVKLIDFGLAARFVEQQNSFAVGKIAGALAYMSPEQTGRMNRWVDYRTDFYSLGIAFYYLWNFDKKPINIIFPYSNRYHPKTATGIKKTWKYTFELP